MNVERVLREVEKRLASLGESERQEVLDSLREEIGRERRRIDPSSTVEKERERRLEAETLREILEAINRQARLEDTIGEVLKQLSRLVTFDACSLSLCEADGRFRVIAVRGFPEPGKVVGMLFRDELSQQIRLNRWPITLRDAQEDPRYEQQPNAPVVRSWAGIPLMVEGEVIGLLSLDRHSVVPFDEDELHRAKAVAFSAAATIRKAKLLEQVRRYASLMENLVTVDQSVFAGKPADTVARAILLGAVKVGSYRGGLLVLSRPDGARVAAVAGDGLRDAENRLAPAALLTRTPARLKGDAVADVARQLSVDDFSSELYLVPFGTPEASLGTLVLVDPDGETPDDQLMEAYASRAAAALLHASRLG